MARRQGCRNECECLNLGTIASTSSAVPLGEIRVADVKHCRRWGWHADHLCLLTSVRFESDAVQHDALLSASSCSSSDRTNRKWCHKKPRNFTCRYDAPTRTFLDHTGLPAGTTYSIRRPSHVEQFESPKPAFPSVMEKSSVGGQALEARRKAPRLRPAQLPTKPQAPRLTLSPCRAGPSGLAHGPVFFDARAAPCGFDTGGRRHEPSVRTIGCTFLPAAGHSG